MEMEQYAGFNKSISVVFGGYQVWIIIHQNTDITNS